MKESKSIGSSAIGSAGIVASGGKESVAATLEILEKGGNAADAGAAAVLALSVTDYGRFCIGAECPFMYFDAKSKVARVFNGQGGAPLDKTAIDWYMKNGIPAGEDIKNATVPAIIDLVVTVLSRFGTMTFSDISQPMIELLGAEKEEWYSPLKKTMERLFIAEHSAGTDRVKGLKAVSNLFYRGEIADQLDSWYRSQGSFLRKVDLESHITYEEDPVSASYRGYDILKCNTWTQGAMLCQALKILDGFDLKAMGHLSSECIHLITEALKLAMADRDMYYGDPRVVNVPLKQLLSDEYTALRRKLISMKSASGEIRPGDPVAMKALAGPGVFMPNPGGTTTLVIADKWGNMVSATPSGNKPYHINMELGIPHATRMTSLNTCKGHPNCIEPGKRPRITLTPTMVLKNGRAVMAVSVAGGDFQDQTALNVLVNHIDFGMPPEKAVTAPRFATRHYEDSFNPAAERKSAVFAMNRLEVSGTMDKAINDKLEKMGHEIKIENAPIADPVMLIRDPDTGMAMAAGDPTAGRHAGAL